MNKTYIRMRKSMQKHTKIQSIVLLGFVAFFKARKFVSMVTQFKSLVLFAVN